MIFYTDNKLLNTDKSCLSITPFLRTRKLLTKSFKFDVVTGSIYAYNCFPPQIEKIVFCCNLLTLYDHINILQINIYFMTIYLFYILILYNIIDYFHNHEHHRVYVVLISLIQFCVKIFPIYDIKSRKKYGQMS